ncbi:MAG: hypothetical protein J5824_07330 [Lachnospiraceae bacterium]|nr:hypothetical protein [Lachnospiraceae bacterium]
MGRKLYGLLIFVAAVLLFAAVSFTTKAEAATKPKVSKSKVTLYTNSDKYTIELKNIADNAKITYTSSDKSVITVKKGVVTPKKAGKASVKIKVKQNKKTYKLKIVFIVKEAPAQDNDVKSGDDNEKNSDKDKNTDNGNNGKDDYSEDTVKKSTERSLFAEERNINNAFSAGSTGKLTSDEKALYDKVVSIAKKLKGSSEYDTVKNIHDYLVSSIAYPSSWSGDGVHSLNYALNKGVCVCDGYAKAFYFLCKANGIEALIVGGKATDEHGTDSHAWNKVKINGKWYTADVTWDDPFPDDPGTVRYDYFLIKDSDISRSHTWDDKGIPDAYSDDLGIVYEQYKDIEKYEKADEALKAFQNKAKEFLEKREWGTTLEVQFLVYSGNNALVDTITELLNTYHSSYGCGYGYSIESAGFYGMWYTLKLLY